MMERIKIYNEENFEYKLIKVDLKWTKLSKH
jgi:hypothetical protein